MGSVAFAINTLEMTKNENEVFSVDFTQWLPKSERIIGVVSVTVTPSGGPIVSNIAYSTFGKSVSFRLDGTGGSVNRGTFEVSLIVTTQNGAIQNQKEAKGRLLIT